MPVLSVGYPDSRDNGGKDKGGSRTGQGMARFSRYKDSPRLGRGPPFFRAELEMWVAGILTRHSPFIRTRGRCRIVSGRDKKLICGTFEARGDAEIKRIPVKRGPVDAARLVYRDLKLVLQIYHRDLAPFADPSYLLLPVGSPRKG